MFFVIISPIKFDPERSERNNFSLTKEHEKCCCNLLRLPTELASKMIRKTDNKNYRKREELQRVLDDKVLLSMRVCTCRRYLAV